MVERTGTLVDATVIPPASTKNKEARWAGHRRRGPVYGYMAHAATDQGAGLVRGVEVTTANAHDASELAAILPDAPDDTCSGRHATCCAHGWAWRAAARTG